MNTFSTPRRSPFGDLFDRLQSAETQSEVDDIVNEARARASRVDPVSLEYLSEAEIAEEDGDEDFANLLRDANDRWYMVE